MFVSGVYSHFYNNDDNSNENKTYENDDIQINLCK